MTKGVAVGATGRHDDGGASLFEGVATWCESLQGHVPLIAALRALARGLDARAAVLSRHSRGRADASARCIVHDDGGAGPAGPVARSHARSVLGPFVERPRVGSVWYSSLAEVDDDPALGEFQRRAGLVETVVIPLAVDDRSVDFLEVHFAARLGAATQARLNLLADTLGRTWARRRPGLFGESVLASRPSHRAGPPALPLMSASNPARLSRAEFRICMLLSRGLATEAIRSELEISQSTLKSHLRSIYAKTDTASQSELLFLLLAPAAPAANAADPLRRRA